MRDPNRIDDVLNFLRSYWKANPDLRLGQIVVNGSVGHDVFYIEDDDLVEGIKNPIEKLSVVLVDPGAKKIHVIKEVRSWTGLGLKDSKDLVDNAPSTIGAFDEIDAKELHNRLLAVGADVRVEG